jgi:HlyD family secretion protein
VEIKKGVKLGDRLVVDGAGYIKDGDKVRVVKKQ